MNITVLVFSVVLFFALTPGILVTLPKNGGKITVAAVHALVFALVFYFSNKFIGQLSEGFKEGKCMRKGGCAESNSGPGCYINSAGKRICNSRR
uniref:Uncharacterized protein n=1 Tax=viral metagenome TaxID=1070528 RepID=A0A6C0B2I9_9ZZZZ